MRSYTANKYQSLVDETNNSLLKNFMSKERGFIASIPNAKSRTFVDLGAGHGRILAELASLGKNVIAIEINPKMYPELKQRSTQFDNTVAVHGDILNLEDLLKDKQVNKPVFLIVQNSLGTIEGDYKELLNKIKIIARKYDGELVLSLFRQRTLKDKGLDMYASLKDMVGEVDLVNTNTDKGIFASKTGYTSKWWTDQEIEDFCRFGHVVDKKIDSDFIFIRQNFKLIDSTSTA